MSALSHPLRASILSLGFSNSDGPFTQAELLKCFSSRDNPKLSHFFDHPHIDTRYLILPPQSPNGNAVEESTGALLKKHKSAALEMGQKAVNKTLVPLGISPDQIDFVCCVSSTGFLVPGLSALLAQRLGFRSDCQRVDIVGMGCHGGLNGLSTVSNWCELNRRKKALLICSEVCSAIYSIDDTAQTAVVNSLFGDGTAVALLESDSKMPIEPLRASLSGYTSFLIPNTLDSLRFDWDDIKKRFSFFIGRETPRLLAENIEIPLMSVLAAHGLTKQDIQHWVVHTGGAAILDALQARLGLTDHQLRHTKRILKKYGNLSSGSFLFSYDDLLREQSAQVGDYGVFITMGPGLAIEVALFRWLI